MKIYIVIQKLSTWDGWHGTESVFNIGVYSTKELADSHCCPTHTEQNSGEECTTEWHVEEWDLLEIEDNTCEDCHTPKQTHCFHCDPYPM